MIWRSRSISSPAPPCGPAPVGAPSIAAKTSGPVTPSRCSPSCFWYAITAEAVAASVVAVDIARPIAEHGQALLHVEDDLAF